MKNLLNKGGIMNEQFDKIFWFIIERKIPFPDINKYLYLCKAFSSTHSKSIWLLYVLFYELVQLAISLKYFNSRFILKIKHSRL